MSAKNIMVSAVVSALVAATTTYALNVTGLLRLPVDVPSVIGLRVDGARALIEREGLLLTVSEEREDAKLQPGQIVAQVPLEGSKLYRGASVSVVVAKAITSVAVPELLGKPLAEAKLALEEASLSLGKVSDMVDTKVPVTSVLEQNPAARAEVKPGTAVDLVVSKLEETFAVPQVVGKGLGAARRDLKKAGFAVGKVRYEEDEYAEEGVVLEQSPAAEAQAAKGAAIDLIINAFE